MKRLILWRDPSTDQGTTGDLTSADGIVTAVDMERRWANNQPNISCILPAPGDPPIVYQMTINPHSKFGPETWELQNVLGRTNVELHIANRERELLGCIAPGLSKGTIGGELAVLDSAVALQTIKEYLRPDIQAEIQIGWKA